MSDIKAKFDELLEKQRALRTEFQVTAQALFKETFKEFFALNPKITAVMWTQATPYFNDGEPCEFRVNDVYFTNATPEEMENICSYGEYEGEDENVWSENAGAFDVSRTWNKDFQDSINLSDYDVASIKYLSDLIQSSEMEDIMLQMFDDHARIIATREGFDVDEYSHD